LQRLERRLAFEHVCAYRHAKGRCDAYVDDRASASSDRCASAD